MEPNRSCQDTIQNNTTNVKGVGGSIMLWELDFLPRWMKPRTEQFYTSRSQRIHIYIVQKYFETKQLRNHFVEQKNVGFEMTQPDRTFTGSPEEGYE